jgi:hypothetical protein
MTHNLPLQKDLEILREEVNRPSGRFDYMLFHQNQHIETRKHNREMTFGAVIVNVETGQIRLDSLRANQGSFEPYIIEDNHAFIVPVTIRS